LQVSIFPVKSLFLIPKRVSKDSWLVSFYLTGIVLVLALSGCSDPVPQLRPLPADATILAFGDSLTYGTGVNRDQSYPAVLEQLVQRHVVNAGVPGEVTSEALARLPGALKKYRPALVILCHGGNDILRKMNLAQTSDNLRAMIRMIRQAGASVVLLGVPKPGLMFLKSADFYQTIAHDNQIPFEAEIIPTIETDNTLKSDAIHPNQKGYRMLAQAVAALLRTSAAI
jgi:acyl-CoA thioesterase-1